MLIRFFHIKIFWAILENQVHQKGDWIEVDEGRLGEMFVFTLHLHPSQKLFLGGCQGKGSSPRRLGTELLCLMPRSGVAQQDDLLMGGVGSKGSCVCLQMGVACKMGLLHAGTGLRGRYLFGYFFPSTKAAICLSTSPLFFPFFAGFCGFFGTSSTTY